MPRSKRPRHSFDRESVSEPRRIRNNHSASVRCTRCNLTLIKTTDSHQGDLCQRCKRSQKYRWKEKQNKYQQESRGNNRVLPFDDSVNKSGYPQPQPVCLSNVPFEIMERRIYTTPSLESNNFHNQQFGKLPEVWDKRVYSTPPAEYHHFHNQQRNTSHPTSHFNGELHVKPYINEASNSTHNYYPPNADVYKSPPPYDRGIKRRQESENQSAKRFRLAPPTLNLKDNKTQPFSQLTANIWMYFYDNRQTDEVYERKINLWQRLQSIIQSKFSSLFRQFFGRHCSRADLFVFGSSINGFGTKNSDVDMCLMLDDVKSPKTKTIRILGRINGELRMHGFTRNSSVIPAKVPILKFKDSISGFEVDLNINNPTGIRNSRLLRSYGRLDERVCPLILAIKFWARFHDINDAKTNTLSSYALGLMLIHYLQFRCGPAVLPALQVLQPNKYLPNSDVRSFKVNEDLPNFKSGNHENVGQLFAGFLQYYSKEYDYDNSRISVRLGKVIPRVERKLNQKNQLMHWIDIEEPFELTNVARSANNSSKFEYMKSVFDNS